MAHSVSRYNPPDDDPKRGALRADGVVPPEYQRDRPRRTRFLIRTRFERLAPLVACAHSRNRSGGQESYARMSGVRAAASCGGKLHEAAARAPSGKLQAPRA